MQTGHEQAASDPHMENLLLKAHLAQDLGIPIAAVFEREEGAMAGADAVSYVTEAQRLIRLGQAHGDILTSGYVYCGAHYFFNSNDARPVPDVVSERTVGPEAASGTDVPAASVDMSVAEPTLAPAAPRAHALLAAMAHVNSVQSNAAPPVERPPQNVDAVPRGTSVIAPTRVVFQTAVVRNAAGPTPPHFKARKLAPSMQCTFQGTQTHVVGEQRNRLSIEEPAQLEITAGTRLAYKSGPIDVLRLIEAPRPVQDELPMPSMLEVDCQPENRDGPS